VRILDGGIVTPDSCCLLAALVFSIFPKVARAERLLRDLTEIEEFFGNTFYIKSKELYFRNFTGGLLCK